MTQRNFTRASAADVARNFGKYKELAQRGPVEVTSHGRDSIVLLSAEEFARLKAFDDRQALYSHELPAELIEALETACPPESTRVFDREVKPR